MDNHLIRYYAKFFHEMGLNISCISNIPNSYNYLEHNILKAPNHEWKHLQSRRQEEVEFNNYDWENSLGLGIILGYENIMAIDIDGCIDFDLIKFFCRQLGVPSDYEWIFISGSKCGFHMVFYCDDISDLYAGQHLKRKNKVDLFGQGETSSYYPMPHDADYHLGSTYISYDKNILDSEFNDNFWLKDLFKRIEFKWSGHLVLPPSYHQSGLNYSFHNNVPKNKPIKIKFETLRHFQSLVSLDRAFYSTSFYNRHCNALEDTKEKE
ncbi:MAG: bifunctional DNA primase/polymerase, partial [Bacteroidales bacterium]|nr:bifunctional DNA primase/polymerase [Bacteroidales bacterium]